MLTKSKPAEAKRLLQEAQQDVNERWKLYQYLAERQLESHNGHGNGHSSGGNGKGVTEPQQAVPKV